MLIGVRRGQGSVILRVKILNSSVSTGAGLTGLSSTSSGLIISTIADTESTATAYTVAASNVETITTNGTFSAPTAGKCRFKELDATNHKGVYEIQIADARFNVSNAKSLLVSVSGATNAAETDVVIPLRDLDPFDAVRAGLTALPNVASGSAGAIITSGTGTAQLSVSSGQVTVATNNDKTGYSLTQTFPSNFGSLAITAGGIVTANTTQLAGQTVTAAAGVTFPATVSSLTAGGVRTELTTELGRIDVAVSSRLATASYTTPPTAAANASAVRTELTTELGRIDASVSSRMATFTLPTNFAALGINGSGHLSRVTLVDTTTTNTDMRGTDNAALAASWTATRAGYLDSVLIAANANQRTVQVNGNGHVASVLHSSEPDSITVGAFAADSITGSALAASAATEVATATLGATVEGTETLVQAVRLVRAALVGKLSGAATTTVTIRDAADSKARITATVDADGNRSAVTTDAT